MGSNHWTDAKTVMSPVGKQREVGLLPRLCWCVFSIACVRGGGLDALFAGFGGRGICGGSEQGALGAAAGS
jgi:hypothetical protein